jgi:uncharacterized alkaline shock family protein YloU
VSDDAIMRPGYQVAGSVLDAIAQRAAEEVDGVQVLDRRMRGRDVTVSVDGDRLSASLALQVRFGVVLPEAAEEARLRVAGALAQMTGMPVTQVDVVVAAVV